MVEQVLFSGISVVAEREDEKPELIAVVSAVPLGINVCVGHVLTDLTVVVHPEFQKLGLGKELAVKFLTVIKQECTHIGIVEFFIRETATDTIKYFESIGFKQQGKLDGRIKTIHGYEAELVLSWINNNYEEEK